MSDLINVLLESGYTMSAMFPRFTRLLTLTKLISAEEMSLVCLELFLSKGLKGFLNPL